MTTTAFRKNTLAMAAAALAASINASAADVAPAVLQTVIVKGEKIQRKLDETQSSVAVNTAEDLREHGDKSLADVLTRTPGVYTTAGNENWGIRGVPVSGFDDQGPATLNGAVSVIVDGALQSNRSLTLSPLMLWDVEQIEIFRGPQSTVQGRNALAGAVVVQTKNPSYVPSAAVQVNAGNYGERGAAAAIGGAIADGVAAARLSFDYQESDGYIRNETLNKNADLHRSANLRGKVLVQPTDKLDVLLTLAHNRNRQGNNSVALVDDKAQYFKLLGNTDEFDRITQDTASAKVDYALNKAWTLTSLTAVTRSTYDSLLDFDENATDRMEVVRNHNARLASEELRLAYQTSSLRGHLGAYYGRSSNRFEDRLNADGAPFGGVAGETKITNHALFGELEWGFAPDWRVTTGLRHDRERNETDVTQDDFASPGRDGRTFRATLPKLGVSYQVTPDSQIGLMAQKGYRSGGVNVRAGAGHLAYDPEYTTTVELSYRGSWLDKRLRTSANAYHTDWKDQQVSVLDSTGSFFEVHNAARSRMKGLEANADFDVTSTWRISTGVSYNDARYRNFIFGGGNDLSGQAFLYAPKTMWTLGGRYRTGVLTLSADAVYRAGSPSEYLFDGSGQVTGVRRGDNQTLLNLNAEYRITKGMTVGGYVQNLFNERYVVNNRSGTTVDVGAPRRLGVVLRHEL
jgi:iron complex outermembrane recepter protein